MLHVIWRGGSLRTWIAAGMALAVLPLAISGFAGYLLLSRGVIASFQDVASRQRNEIDPTQRLRLMIAEAAIPLDDYMDEADPQQPPAYRAIRGRIESAFADVHQRMGGRDPELAALVERARGDWTTADNFATEALSVRRAAGDERGATLMDEFHGASRSAIDKLGAVYDALDKDLRDDHDVAIHYVERSEWLAIIAAIVSLVAIAGGVLLIGRVMSASVERLVSGAELFAAGDRDHRIDVSVPPELHRVAQEFNRMIGRIHESEDALANLARRDSLTMLLNRRAFDEEAESAFARLHRFGEQFALLVLDLDRFKAINDTYGHAIGDDVLRAAARALSGAIRPFDKAFRIGGEELAVILSGSEYGALQATADRLRQAIAQQSVQVAGVTVPVTASVGAAMASREQTATSLLAAADGALYQAKNTGRDRVVIAG